MQSIASNAATAAAQSISTPMTSPGGAGGLLNAQKDVKEAQTDAQFGEVLKNMQAKYGAKTEKPREIKKTLGKDDFLRIMITQMRHQDPTNPFKAEQMASEMAQFTSVEQLQNLNQGMQKMANQNQPLERLAMTNLIGKTITVDRDRFAHVDGQNESLSFHLPKPASQVQLVVISEQGEVIMEKEIGAQKQGEGSYIWDGLKKNTLPAKSGNYVLRVEAKDENGVAIKTDPLRRQRVVGVSFEGGEPILLVGDNKSQEKVTMKNVIRIENDLPGVPGAPSGAASGASGGMPQAGPNFISFKKGEGSGNLDASQVNQEVAQALAKYQESAGAGSAAASAAPLPSAAAARPPSAAPTQNQDQPATPMARAASAVKAEGFPNGLQDEESTHGKLSKGGESK